MQSQPFSHLDENARAQMVDVGPKSVTRRQAVARATIRMGRQTAEALKAFALPKGDVLQVARVAAIGAAKRTDELIPLCHSLPLDSVSVDFGWLEECVLWVQVTACATARTGVEMEALVGASIAALTIYDMCKAQDKSMSVENVQLISKTGGKSGDWYRNN